MILDLFAGPRGWSEGLRQLGLADFGIELDEHAHATARAAGHAGLRADVTKLNPGDFGYVEGFIGSPVCKPYSRAGKGGGILDQALVHQAIDDAARGKDTRTELGARCRDSESMLTAEPMRYIHTLQPDWVAMEQVPDVLPIWQQYALLLRERGYFAWCGVLCAADYGVPQTRTRAILIANRHQQVLPPEPTHAEHPHDELFGGPTRKKWVSMAEALGWTTGLKVNTRGARKTPGGNEFSADGPSWALTEKTRSWWALRNGNQPNAAVRPVDEPAPTMAFGHNAARIEWVLRSNSQAKAAVRSVTEPASTLFFGHRCNAVVWSDGEDKRPITQQEAAVLQSFRHDYPWQGSKTKQFEQIGNAVPPLLAAHVLAAATGQTQPRSA